MKNTRTNDTVTMRIGKTNITIKPYDNNNVLFYITSDIKGFKTILKLSIKEVEEIYSFIIDNNFIDDRTEVFSLLNIKIKHRKYIKTGNDFDMKYFNTSRGRIRITCLDGCTVVFIEEFYNDEEGEEEKDIYEHFCYDTGMLVYEINRVLKKVKEMIGENMMNNNIW